MHQCIDDGFAQDDERNAPDILSLDIGKVCPSHGVLLQEVHDLPDAGRQTGMNLGVIQDMGLVPAGKAPALNPRIGKMKLAIPPEQQHAAPGRYQASLITHQHPKTQ